MKVKTKESLLKLDKIVHTESIYIQIGFWALLLVFGYVFLLASHGIETPGFADQYSKADFVLLSSALCMSIAAGAFVWVLYSIAISTFDDIIKKIKCESTYSK